MRIALTKSLFAWDCLEDSPSLKTVKAFLEPCPTPNCIMGRMISPFAAVEGTNPRTNRKMEKKLGILSKLAE